MKNHKAISRTVLFLLLANAFLVPQALAEMDNDTDSPTGSEKTHRWKFDEKKSDSAEYGVDINGQRYTQTGTVVPTTTSPSAPQQDAAAGTDAGDAPHHWNFDDKKETSSPYGMDISGKSYNKDGTVSTSTS